MVKRDEGEERVWGGKECNRRKEIPEYRKLKGTEVKLYGQNGISEKNQKLIYIYFK